MPLLVSVLPSDLARTRGGAERYAFELQSALGEQLPDWSMVGLVAASRDPDRHVPEGWVAVGGRRSMSLPPGDAISASTALRCVPRQAAVVICHQWRTRATTALRCRDRFRAATGVVGIDYGGGSRLGYYLAWPPLPGADVGVHISEFERAISPVVARRHAVIRGGIDRRRFVPGSRPPAVEFLMVGRFLPYKGQLRFLECLPPGARARLIGPSDSEDPAYLAAVSEKAASLGVQVDFDVSDEDLASAYQGSRYTVQVPIDPRRYHGAAPPELLGLTMLEAMACGSVPICPTGGASAEFVSGGRTGLTYEPGSAQDLTRVLGMAAGMKDEHQRLREGAMAEAERWSWSAAASGLLSLL